MHALISVSQGNLIQSIAKLQCKEAKLFSHTALANAF